MSLHRKAILSLSLGLSAFHAFGREAQASNACVSIFAGDEHSLLRQIVPSPPGKLEFDPKLTQWAIESNNYRIERARTFNQLLLLQAWIRAQSNVVIDGATSELARVTGIDVQADGTLLAHIVSLSKGAGSETPVQSRMIVLPFVGSMKEEPYHLVLKQYEVAAVARLHRESTERMNEQLEATQEILSQLKNPGQVNPSLHLIAIAGQIAQFAKDSGNYVVMGEAGSKPGRIYQVDDVRWTDGAPEIRLTELRRKSGKVMHVPMEKPLIPSAQSDLRFATPEEVYERLGIHLRPLID